MSAPNDVSRKLATLYASPALLPQNLDLIHRRVLLLEFDERRYRETAFLDDRMIDERTAGFWTGLETLPAPDTARAACWLFHIGHCGSTLLSRLLPALCPMLPVREPPPLRTLAESLRHLSEPLSRLDPSGWQPLFRRFVALYSRTYATDGLALIKPSSDCVNLIRAALEVHAGSRGVLTFRSLESYLATMMVGPDARPDIDGHAVTRLMDLHAFLDDHQALRLYELGPVQRVVVSWLAGVAGLHAATRACGDRVRCVNFDTFAQDPGPELARLVDFLGTTIDEGQIGAVVNGPVMHTYAKAPEYRFSPSDREARLAENRSRSSVEIAEGLRWAETLIGKYDALQPVVARFPLSGPAG